MTQFGIYNIIDSDPGTQIMYHPRRYYNIARFPCYRFHKNVFVELDRCDGQGTILDWIEQNLQTHAIIVRNG